MTAPPSAESGPSAARPRWERWLLLLPPILALAIHAGSLRHGFIGDDGFLILTNPQITRSTPLSELLLTDWFNRGGPEAIGYYRPVVKATFRATYALVGAAPAAYHVTNWIAHALAALLVAVLLRRFLPFPAAIAGGILFGVHPSTVQAVDIVTARSDVLAALFTLAACAAFAEWARPESTRPPRPLWLAASLLAGALAVGSKESALLLPALLGALALALGERPRAALRACAPFLGLVAAYALLRSRLHLTPIPNALSALGWPERILAMGEALGSYLGPLILGKAIVLLPRRPASAVDLQVLLGLAAVVAAIAVLAWRRLRGALSFGLVLIGAGLAPVLPVWVLHIPMWKDDVPISERWLYLPTAGVALCAAALLARIRPKVALPLTAALAAALGVEAVQRTPAYASDAAYASYVADFYREASADLSPREQYLSKLYDAGSAARDGQWDLAMGLYREATALSRWQPDAWVGISEVAERLGRADEVVGALELLLSPQFAKSPEANQERKSYANDSFYRLDRSALFARLARGYRAQGREELAAKAFERAAHLERAARAVRDTGPASAP